MTLSSEQLNHALKIVVENFVANIEYNAWLRTQRQVKQEKGADVTRIVQEERHWKEVSVIVGALEPITRVLRLTDGW